MSWLGVNLNDSINSIKGQITNITREILTEEDGPEDGCTEVLIPKKKLKELETSIVVYQEEIKSLNDSRAELEDRLRASDYNTFQKISSLQKQLSESQEELRTYKNKSSEWNWEHSGAEMGEFVGAINTKTMDSNYVDKISLLQKQLQDERQKHEVEILALQDAYQNGSKNLGNEVLATRDDGNVSLRQRIDQLSLELKSLGSENYKLRGENEQLNNNLVDLDSQHQLIVDELLKGKSNLADELKESKEVYQKLFDSRSTQNDGTETVSKLEQEIRVLKEKNTDLEQQVSKSVTVERETQNELIASLQNDNEKALKKISEAEIKIDDLGRCCTDKDQDISRLSSLVSELEKKTESIESLQTEIKNSRTREEKTSTENSTLAQRLSLTESELRSKLQNISELSDKLSAQQVEVMKFEAVVEEKESIHSNLHRKLSEHEEVAKRVMQEFKSENLELENKLKSMEKKKKKLETELEEKSKENHSRSQNDDFIQKLLKQFDVKTLSDVLTATSELNSEVASLRCERDKLNVEFSATSQELRDAHELVENLEIEKIELEKDAEDLRDQLEELQCGERPTPEGSHAPRGLPTIEEEESDITANTGASGSRDIVKDVASSVSESLAGSEGVSHLNERIEHLNSQVIALGEARQNLEMELSRVNTEKEGLEQRLAVVNSQLGNLSNLEVEAASLRSENVNLQQQLNQRTNEYFEMQEFQTHLEKMSASLKDMNIQSCSKELEFGREKEALLNQIKEQIQTISEINENVSRLETALKEAKNNSSVISEYEEKLTAKGAELDKAKCLVIYKDDQIDQLKQGIELIGEIYDLHDVGLRQLYVHIKQKHHNLVAKLDETTEEIATLKEIEESADDENELATEKLKTSLQTITTRLSETQNELEKVKELSNMKLEERENELTCLKSENDELLNEKNELIDRLTGLTSENEKRHTELDTVKGKITSLELTVTERESLIFNLQSEVSHNTDDSSSKINSLEAELSSKITEIANLNKILSQNSTDFHQWKEDNLKILQEELAISLSSASKLKEEKDHLMKSISKHQEEKKQIILTSHQKHQESVTYYNEIQRLSEVLQVETQRYASDIGTLTAKLEEAEREKKTASDELASLRSQFQNMEHNSVNKNEVTKLKADLERRNDELLKINEEFRKLQEMSEVIMRERDHLRVANSSFNSQYEDKSKEVSVLQEKEKHLSQEIIRLKQHLIEVEETYTKEAVLSEQKEASLRQSLAKMHEKIASNSTFLSNANQKSVAQVESIQEQLTEAIVQRDELKQKLQSVEEISIQHQESLSRLQQVLQDFQKNQMKDISSATERERRKLEEQRGKNSELENQILAMKSKLLLTEESLAASQSLMDQLLSKEDTIVALKSQVNAIQLAAKKNQDQLANLQSVSEAKVDKHLVRNLVVGYCATPFDKQREVMKVIAQVLDFSSEERSRTGIDKLPGSWMTSISNFLAPPPSNMRIISKVDVLDHSSLSQAFIRFLEEESSPRTQARLPAVQMAEEANKKAQKKAQMKAKSLANSQSLSTSTVDSTDSQFSDNTKFIPGGGTNSNTVTTTNPLLFSSVLPESIPVITVPAVPVTASTGTEVSTSKYLSNLLQNSADKDVVDASTGSTTLTTSANVTTTTSTTAVTVEGNIDS